jgi:hemerythrin
MTRETHSQPQFETVIEDHRRLRELLELIRATLARRDHSVHRLADLLTDLMDDLRMHFDHEEKGGYLEDALALAPHFAMQASRLVNEHGEFLLMVREMQHATANDEWDALKTRFQDFSHRFEAHEASENRLVQDAMLRDIEAED